MKAKKFVLEPSTPKKMMTDASPTHEAAALERALPITPSTPPAVEATTTVASKCATCRLLGAGVAVRRRPADLLAITGLPLHDAVACRKLSCSAHLKSRSSEVVLYGQRPAGHGVWLVC